MNKNNGTLEDRSAAISKFRAKQAKPYLFDQTGKLIDYWFSLPKKGLVPDKSSINPRQIAGLLSGAIMLEKNSANGGYRIRLSGTGNTMRWGFEATNTNYINFVPPQHHFIISEKFSQILEYPCGLILRGNELYTSGRTISTEMVLFPVSTDAAGGPILFGLITASTDQSTEYGGDILASVFYTISASHYINVGAGVPD